MTKPKPNSLMSIKDYYVFLDTVLNVIFCIRIFLFINLAPSLNSQNQSTVAPIPNPKLCQISRITKTGMASVLKDNLGFSLTQCQKVLQEANPLDQ